MKLLERKHCEGNVKKFLPDFSLGDRMRFGIVKLEKQVFPFASALTFHYLWIR